MTAAERDARANARPALTMTAIATSLLAGGVAGGVCVRDARANADDGRGRVGGGGGILDADAWEGAERARARWRARRGD